MKASESIAQLAASLVKAQAKIEGATKDKVNPHFRSKYADLSSVVEAIKGPVTEEGLTYTQVMHDAENAAKVETIILHNSGEWLSCGVISVPVSKHDAQGFGSALTYARRYSLSAAFGVAPEDDDGNAAAAAAPRPQRIEDKIIAAGITPNAGAGESLTPEQKKRVQSCADEVNDAFGAGFPDAAFEAVETFKFDNDEKLFLWSLLGSKERNGLKKLAKAKQEKLKEMGLATQP
jgi:hypothetical protein